MTRTRHHRERRRTIAAAMALLAAIVFATAGCEVADPALPTFSTRLAVPVGVHEVTVAELIEDQDVLVAGADSVLAFSLEGDTTELELDFDLAADLAGESLDVNLGPIDLPDVGPLPFGFVIEDLFPGAGSLPPGPVPVPPFDFDIESEPSAVDGVESAELSAGLLRLVIVNDLPVPVSGDAPPARLDIELRDPDGGVVATLRFDGEIAPGESAEATADLAGTTLPGDVIVGLVGGSPGGFAADGVSPDDGLSVSVSMEGLTVVAATAAVEAQGFDDAGELPLPDDLRVQSAVFAVGELAVDMRSDLPVPCTAVLNLPEVVDAHGAPVALVLELPADGSASSSLDLANARVTADGPDLLSALGWTVSVTSPGSDGVPVTIAAADRIQADILPTTLELAEVTGEIPEETFVLDPVSEDIDLPDELSGLHLQSAVLAIEIRNGTGVGGVLDLQVAGIGADGDTTTVSAYSEIMADEDKDTRTLIILDETNSDIAELLSQVPERFVLSGEVRVGGPGEIGTVRSGDGGSVSWRMDAPLHLVVDPTSFDQDPEPLGLDADMREQLEDHLVQAEIVAEVTNHFPFAVDVGFVVGADAATTMSDPLLTIGPLVVDGGEIDPVGRWVAEPGVSTLTIALDGDQVRAFTRPGAHVAVTAALPGTDGEDVIVRLGDYLSVTGALSAEVFVDGD